MATHTPHDQSHSTRVMVLVVVGGKNAHTGIFPFYFFSLVFFIFNSRL